MREVVLGRASAGKSALDRAKPGPKRVRTAAPASDRIENELLAVKVKRLQAYIQTLKAEAEDIPILRSRMRDLEQIALEREEKVTELERQISARYSELAYLTAELMREEEKAEKQRNSADSLLTTLRVLVTEKPLWWNFMPRRWRYRREARRLARFGLFDAEAYAREHPDVIAAGQDPLRHYVFHGIEEIRAGTRRAFGSDASDGDTSLLPRSRAASPSK